MDVTSDGGAGYQGRITQRWIMKLGVVDACWFWSIDAELFAWLSEIIERANKGYDEVARLELEDSSCSKQDQTELS